MPFTLSHAIAVFPLRRFSGKYVSMTGLIAGSMAPDFEFFLRVTLYGDISHTWLGFFIFDFPVGLLIAFLFHWMIKDVLIDNLPNLLYVRLLKYKGKDWLSYFRGNFVIVVLSVLFGIFTHFVWDNLTHEPNYISRLYFDVLLEPFNIFGSLIPLYSILQMVSSVVGILVLGFAIWQLPVYRDNAAIHRKITRYWILTASLATILMMLRYLLGVPSHKPVGQLVVISISTILFALLFISGYYKWFKTN